MAKKTNTLRDQLKELENPAFAVTFNDPEDEDDLTKAKVTSTEELLQVQEGGTFGNLRKKAVLVTETENEPKYSGKKTTRVDLKKWHDGDQGESDAEVDSGEDDVVGGKEGMDDDDDDDDSDDDSEDSKDEDDIALDQDDSPDDDSMVEDDDIENEKLADNAMIFDPSKIPNDLKTLFGENNDDDRSGVSTFAQSKEQADRRKGEATKSQLAILDKMLESRIRLQKSLQLTNRLPQNDTMKEFKSHGQVKEVYETAKGSLLHVLRQLLSLQDMVLNTNIETGTLLTSGIKKKSDVLSDEEIKSDTEDEEEEKEEEEVEEKTSKNILNLPSKRKHTLTIREYEEEISKRHKALKVFQDSTINKWYEKTRLSSGKITSKSFSSFDKSTLQQINQVLSDKDRLIKRTQLKRSPYTILGKTDDTADEVVDPHLKDYDEDIFDDGDFYHEMLKELIERKSNVDSNNPVAASRQWLELQKMRSKIKRKIDTRASKGRKVRYDVHSKLVSFMAPQNVGIMSDQARNDLFASLFGRAPSQPIR